ncbi:MAG: arylesterase [Porticoccaceae bacterium]|nr:arylesterase [Porticoccaceae bacterium]
MNRIRENQFLKFDFRRSKTLIVMLSILFLTTNCGEKLSLQALTPDSVILAFGDSLTYGTGVKPEDSYPTALEKFTGLKLINAGIPGEVTAEGLKRLPLELAKHKPNLVIICHGGNDILRKLPLDQSEANLRAMAELSREAGADVVLVAVPEFGLWKSTPDFYARVAADLAVPLEESILPELEFDPAMKSDPIHLNEVGYKRFAEAIANLLENHGALNSITLAQSR